MASPEPAEPSGLPDWLAAVVNSGTPEPPAPEPGQIKAFDTDALKELGTLGGTGGLPDWMAGFSAGSAASETTAHAAPPAKPAPASAPASPFDEPPVAETTSASPDQTPAAPAAQEPIEPPGSPVTPGTENNPNIDSILSMDMPDWLSGFAPAESSQPAKAGEQPAPAFATDADISPASLPSWVQAMRPMEAVIGGAESSDEDQSTEKVGPLAGLRSVLPGQTGSLETHKSTTYSIKLQVDPTQKAQAALLENLIASEAESQPVATPRRVLVIRSLRWIIAAVLILAVLIPALIPNDILASIFPAPIPEPNSQIDIFRQKIDALPDSATVLVVFDYQPGYAGEMEQASGPVIAHLVNKNVHLAFVSSSPAGVLMSARMIARYPSYQPNENYVDLGYLPGGDAGIQVFASSPQNATGNAQLWLSNALSNLTRKDGQVPLSSFSALLVLTDNPDTGRMWIEQTNQALNGMPLLMVISAQAEPMIRPYLAAGQVQGLVTGLSGGVAYQVASQQAPSFSYWSSYGVGMVATELLILVGGGWALAEHLRARREGRPSPDEEDEA